MKGFRRELSIDIIIDKDIYKDNQMTLFFYLHAWNRYRTP